MLTSPPSEPQPPTSIVGTQPGAAAVPNSSTKLRHTLISLTAGVMVLAFFLPWITFVGDNLNGWDIQKNFSSWWFVWLMPLLALVALVLNMANRNTSLIRRIAGLCPFGLLAYAIKHLGSDLPQQLGIGAWLALLAGTALIFIPSRRKPKTPA